MKLIHLLIKEMLHRRLNLGLSLASVAIGVACVVGTLLTFRVFDIETEQTLASMAEQSQQAWDKFQDEMRKEMLEMGFNLMILHKDYNLSTPPEQARFLPESYVNCLAESRLATINHVLPFLQQKIWWAEKKRWITLVGTTGEVLVQSARQTPMLPRVNEGSVILGFGIHQSLNLHVHDRLVLSDRTFTVQECLPAKGFDEDEQVWIPLSTAQEMLNRKGLITGLLAINCNCAPKDLIKIHLEIAALLPDTQVVEYNSRIMARANVRSKAALEADEALEREKTTREALKEKRMGFAAILVPFIIVMSMAWLTFLMWSNVQQRKSEIGILCAMGMPSRSILALFTVKAAIIGASGSLLGLIFGIALVTARTGLFTQVITVSDLGGFTVYLVVATLMSLLGSWVPALVASQLDPAVTLREE